MKTVLIISGGNSPEHEISIISARNIWHAIDRSKFTPVFISISKSGTWYLIANSTDIERLVKCEDNMMGNTCTVALIRKHGKTYLSPSSRDDLFTSSIYTETKSKSMGQSTIQDCQDGIIIDVAIPIIHGPNGEDGALQGLLDMMHLPYTSSGVRGSALCMDKVVTKIMLQTNKIKVVPYAVLNINSSYEDACSDLESNILFVKSADMGSSIGVSKVRNSKEFHEAIKLAYKFSDIIIAEKAIAGRELECAVLERYDPISNSTEVIASGIAEIIANHDFYSYDAKYIDPNGARLIVDADLDEETKIAIRRTAVLAFRIMRCKIMARVDFFLSNEGELFLNELNTIPGFTQISMYPSLWEQDGMPCTNLISTMICTALASKMQQY